MSTSKNVVWNSLETGKTGLVAFDLLPHLAVQFSTQITFRGQTVLDGSGRTIVRVFFENPLIRFRILFPEFYDPFVLTSGVPLPLMLECSRLELALC